MNEQDESVLYDAPGWGELASHQPWLFALTLLAVLAAGIAVAASARERKALPRGGAWLVGLRLLAILACLGVLLGVQRRSIEQTENPSQVVVLVDRSASMSLPAGAGGDRKPTRSAQAAAAVDQVRERFAAEHEVRLASFDSTVEYKTEADATPDGGATRLGHAIARTLADYEQAPLAAIVTVTDGGWNAGVDPRASVERAKQRSVLVHALGIGPRTEPPSATLRDLAAPPRAAVGDPFKASVTVAANRSAIATNPTRRILLRLERVEGAARAPVYETEIEVVFEPDDRLALGETTINAESTGLYELTAVLLDEVTSDTDAQAIRARIELVDEPTRVLLAAGGPTRDYRFLRDQLFRDEAFEADVLLQSAVGAVTQDAGRILNGLPSSLEELEPYDVVVAIDLDWRSVDESATAALGEWVSRRGGGIVLVSGTVNTAPSVRAGLPNAVRAALPVTIKDDPLALGDAIAAPRDPRPIALTPAGEDTRFLDAPGADGSSDGSLWQEVEGFYAPPLPVELKPGVSVLATYGVGVDEAPLCVTGYYGAGRTVYFATPETWRLRRTSSEWFTAFHTGLLRHAAQGRIRGAAAEGSLLFDRPRYALGETMSLRYVDRLATAATAGRLAAAIAIGNEAPTETPLEPLEDQPDVYAATLRAGRAGRYVATVRTASGDRLAAEAEVTLPSLESQTVVQGFELLESVAEATGGRYIDLSSLEDASRLGEAIRAAASATPSVAETEIRLGAPDMGFARSIARSSLAVMAGALLIEWSLRRAWKLA